MFNPEIKRTLRMPGMDHLQNYVGTSDCMLSENRMVCNHIWPHL
jgi:hypothetical protein